MCSNVYSKILSTLSLRISKLMLSLKNPVYTFLVLLDNPCSNTALVKNFRYHQLFFLWKKVLVQRVHKTFLIEPISTSRTTRYLHNITMIMIQNCSFLSQS